jgi:hypothetical protein
MNNIHRTQNVFVSDGTGLPANDTAVSTSFIAAGTVAILGSDMKALNPAGTDTITTQPYIHIVEAKTDTNGVAYMKRSMKIDGAAVTNYQAKSYTPAQREVWAIGYNRKTSAGTIEVANSTNYTCRIRFKNDKWLYSQRPEELTINVTSVASATQSSIATQVAAAINNSSFTTLVSAIVVGDGTGVYGVTGATNFGVEITAKDVSQFATSTYTPNNVYFSVHVDDSTGFGTTTTCTQIQAFTYGSGTFNQIRSLEDKAFAQEGVTNRRLWIIPDLDYSSTSTYVLSAAITPTVTGTIAEDKVTFSATVAAILNPGEKVELGGVNYEIKYFISSTVAVLTSVLTAGLVAAAAKVRGKYDTVIIEFNDSVNGPTGYVAVANKSVIIAFPAFAAGGAYNSLSTAGTNIKAVLDAWMATTPRAFAAISI